MKRNWRRYIGRAGMAAVLATGMAVLPSCGRSGAGQASGGGAAGKRYKIGVSIPAADHGWTAGIGYWAKQAMADHPEVDWVYQTADTPEKQTADIETMLTRGVDGLVVLATESDPITPVAVKAHGRGVFIVNVDRGFTQPVADIFLEGNNVEFGRKSAAYIVDKLGGKGNVLVLEGIAGTTVNTARVGAAKAVFAAHPDIHVLADQPADWSRQKGLDVTKTLLTRFPHVDAIWAGDDDVALGAIQAIQEAHREKEIWVMGGAGMKDVVKRVMDRDSMTPADCTYPPSMIGTGIHMAASALRDGKAKDLAPMLPKHLVLDVELITPENAKSFYFPESVY